MVPLIYCIYSKSSIRVNKESSVKSISLCNITKLQKNNNNFQTKEGCFTADAATIIAFTRKNIAVDIPIAYMGGPWASVSANVVADADADSPDTFPEAS